MRRPRGPEGRFLTRVEMEEQENKVQNGTSDESQSPETKTRPNEVKREVAKERVVKAIPRQLGEADIARRAGAVPFSLTVSADIELGAVPLPLSSSIQSLSFSTVSLVHGTFEERYGAENI